MDDEKLCPIYIVKWMGNMMISIVNNLQRTFHNKGAVLMENRALKSSVDLGSNVFHRYGTHVYIIPFRDTFQKIITNLNPDSEEILNQLNLEIKESKSFHLKVSHL